MFNICEKYNNAYNYNRGNIKDKIIITTYSLK